MFLTSGKCTLYQGDYSVIQLKFLPVIRMCPATTCAAFCVCLTHRGCWLLYCIRQSALCNCDSRDPPSQALDSPGWVIEAGRPPTTHQPLLQSYAILTARHCCARLLRDQGHLGEDTLGEEHTACNYLNKTACSHICCFPNWHCLNTLTGKVQVSFRLTSVK